MENNSPAAAPDPRRSAGRFLALGFGLAVLALILDQGTKLYIESTMQLGDSVPVIPGILNIHYILNPGAAFSFGENFTIVFALLQAAVFCYVIYLLIRKVRTLSWALTLGALLGGVGGNLIDRIFRAPGLGFGHVVDMISVPGFAIFNVADSFIVCSMIVVAILLLRDVPMNGAGKNTQTATGTDQPQ